MDQDLCLGNSLTKVGWDTASSESGRVPSGDGVLHLLSSEPGLVVEVGLIMLRGA
jgi:hypothetical protein